MMPILKDQHQSNCTRNKEYCGIKYEKDREKILIMMLKDLSNSLSIISDLFDYSLLLQQEGGHDQATCQIPHLRNPE